MAKLTIFRFRGHISREERFRQLFVEIYPRLLRYAIQLMSDREETKDIVGEVMEEAWKCFDRLEAETQNAYFYTATRNTCLNRLKHLRVEQQHLDTLREVTRMDVNTGYRQHEAQLQQAETIACSLSEPTRTILRLCYWEKLTYRQVAERLEISPDTVKKHISKALRILRNEMNGKEETNGTERG